MELSAASKLRQARVRFMGNRGGNNLNAILYRPLRLEEAARIKEIDASQFIGRAWRDVEGIKQLVEINYQDTDFPNGYENHLALLEER